MPRQLLGTAIAANTITTTQLQTTVVNQISAGGGPRVTSLVYPGNDTAGNTVGGQTVYINGSGFETNNAIYINGNAVPSKSFISASNLSFTTPALSAGIYPVYVINTDTGATAIFVPGYVSSAEPTWVTSAGSLGATIEEIAAWSYTLSATGDAPITYALAAGSSLPSGISLAANGLISGTLSSPSGNTTTYTFSVVASDAQNQDSTRQFTVTTAGGEGVLFANNVILIHADGANNGNNHAFVDSSNNNFTITRYGNATQGTFSPFSQTGWSAYFDGTGDYLTAPANTAYNFGTGNFTVEFWAYTTSTARQLIIGNYSSSAGTYGWTFQINVNSTGDAIWSWGNTILSNPSSVWSANRWNHVAIARSGTTTKMFINGIQVSSITDNTNYNDGIDLTISRNADLAQSAFFFTGYISNARVVKGTAVYTTAFTPPTSPLTAIANTSLLTLQSNRFIDNSTNAFTITRNGDTSIQAWSPFAPSTAYSTSVVGGSGYFDGSSDSLTLASNTAFAPGTGDFTLEAWIYPTAAWGTWDGVFVVDVSGGIFFGKLDTGFGLRAYAVSNIVSTTAPDINTWTHVAVSRSGTTVRLFINGTLAASATSSQNFGQGTAYIGNSPSPNEDFSGYISNLRLVKGTAVYTSAFTPPTAPLTNIANTSLLCNFTNAQIFDQTAKNVIETVGDAKVSTAQYKYGTGSMYFDGTGDWLKLPNSPNLGFGSGDYTIECWINGSSYLVYNCIFDNRSPGEGIAFYAGGPGSDNNQLNVANNSALLFKSSSTLTANVWTHVALVRSNGNVSMYINGSNAGANSGANTLDNRVLGSSAIAGIGANYIGTQNFTGYIDDLRITKGYARYTSNFTPPSTAFKDK